MFTETLFGNTKNALAILGNSHLLDNAYLAGGTACALQLGHRISVDLDFFTQKEFDAKDLIRSLKKIGDFKLEQQSWGTILGTIEGIKFSIFVYEYPILFPYKSILDINILDLRDIAAMKVDAIATRGINPVRNNTLETSVPLSARFSNGVKRDFIDLYYMCQQDISLKDALSFYDRKYGELSSNIVHILKSFVYFVDAEISEMPHMLKEVQWQKVKQFFETEVRELGKSVIGIS